MKKLLLGFVSFVSFSFSSFSQSNTLLLTQQVANYDNNISVSGGAFNNNTSVDVLMTTSTDPASQVAAWRKFRTTSDNTGTLRSLQIGDRFSITVNASQANGEIGVGLLSSPTSETSYADRANNYAVSVNLDGPDSTGGGTTYGKWYVRFANGDTLQASFGGTAGPTFDDYKIDFILTATDRMNVTITNTNTAESSTFTDIHLNRSTPITDYSIYVSDADDGSFIAQNVIWKQETSINNTGVISLGQSNKSFLIPGALTDGSNVTNSATNSINTFSKNGTGTITLQSASSYTGSTTLNAGSIVFGVANALPIGSVGNIILGGGTLSSGSTAGFNLGSSSTPAGALQLTNSTVLTLGTGSHSLYFANSSALSWTSAKNLTINGWQGTNSAGGTAGRIFVGNSTSGLTSGELAQITFTGFSAGAALLSTGELVPQYELAPTVAASNLTFTNLQLTSLTVNFTPGNGTGGRIVVARGGSAPTSGPVNGTIYTANNVYGLGSNIGSGYVVFAGTGSNSTTQTFTVTGLSKATNYYFDVYEYDGTSSGASYGLKYEGTVTTPSAYTTVADGTWDNLNTTIWACACVPPANSPITIANNIILGNDESANTLTINSGATLADAGHVLTVSLSMVNNGTHSGTGEIKFAAAANIPITGNGTFQNVESATTGTNLNLIINSNVTINGNLTISSNSVRIIGGKTLTINGSVNGPGTFIGGSSSNLTIGGAAGTLNFNTATVLNRSLNNLSLSNTSSNVAIGTDLDVYGLVSFTGNSHLDFNSKHITLKSLPLSNGVIGDLGSSSLANATNVTVERYIGTSTRAYRSMSSSGVTTNGTINANWQEGGMNPAPNVNVNPKPGYGTQITGAGGNVNGFDVTQTNQNSLYTFNNGSQSYQAISNTNSNILDAKMPYLMYIRGDRSIDVTSQATPLPSSTTTLEQTGTLVTGDQTFTGLAANPSGSSSTGYSMVTNPFASFINFTTIQANNHANALSNGTGDISFNYYYVDPAIGTQGGYIFYNSSLNFSSPTPTNGHPVTNIIQPGQSFFIQAYTGGTPQPAPVFTIREADKTPTGENSTVFKTEKAQQVMRASIFFHDAANNRKIADGVAVVYDDQYGLSVDQNDTPDQSFDENISVNRAGIMLEIEARPSLAANDTLSLFISNMKTQGYELEIEPTNFPQNNSIAELVDNFTGTRTVLSLTDKTIVPFTITTDAGSKAGNRFYIVFHLAESLPVTLTRIRAFKYNTGVKVEWIISQESNMATYEVQHSTNSIDFTTIGQVASKGNSVSTVLYDYIDAGPLAGVNYYRIRMIDKNNTVTYSAVSKVEITSNISLISVYPNPVSGNNLNIHFENIAKGNYLITIHNNLGQLVYSKDINHMGGTIDKSINLGNSLKPGSMILK